MSRSYQRGKGRRLQRKVGGPVQLPLDRDEVIRLMQGEVGSFAVEVGRLVALGILEDEVVRLCGRRYERRRERPATRHGHQPGFITIAGQKVHMDRPRVQRPGAKGELGLESYGLLQREEAMPEAVLRRLLRGVSCRNYAGVVDLAREGFGVKKSSVSRGFVSASRNRLREFAERDLSGFRFPVIFLDGVEYVEQTFVVALGVTSDGTKRLLGFRCGGSENGEVCKSLLDDLCQRGLKTDVPTLFVLDGSKALRSAVVKMWGRNAVVQRCQIHKKRNVQGHLPEHLWSQVEERLNAAYREDDAEKAERSLKTTVAYLSRVAPDAAGSLREGLEETLTVLRLQISGSLRRTLVTTNPVESAFSVARSVTRRVRRWRDGDMRHRWCLAGLLNAETRFRRVKGYKQLPDLIRALDKLVKEKMTKAA